MARFGINKSKDKVAGALNSNLNSVSNSLGSEPVGCLNSAYSRVAEGTYVQGELEFSGNLYFAGKLEGSIQACEGNLELSKSSEVYGDINCHVIDCFGQVTGNIQANGKSVLRDNCKLIGDILTKELAIHSGAEISGNCKMLGDKANMDFFSMPIENLRKHLNLQK